MHTPALYVSYQMVFFTVALFVSSTKQLSAYKALLFVFVLPTRLKGFLCPSSQAVLQSVCSINRNWLYTQYDHAIVKHHIPPERLQPLPLPVVFIQADIFIFYDKTCPREILVISLFHLRIVPPYVICLLKMVFLIKLES